MFVEKYRPREFNEVIGLSTSLQEMMTKTELPHFLFFGPPGTGKTTTARIIVRKLDSVYLEINASDERGIDTIRSKVKDFASVYSEKKRFLLLEEVDGLTPEAQNSLRNIMEKYHSNCKFVLTCNYINKVIEPIQSRCCKFEFSKPSQNEIIERMRYVLSKENIPYDLAALEKIVSDCYPDIRNCINTMERSVVSGTISLNSLVLPSKELEEICEEIKSKKFGDLRKKIASSSFDFPEIYNFLFNKFGKNSVIKKEAKGDIMIEIAERLYKDGYIANREMNFLAGVIKIWKILDAAGVTEY